MIINNCVYYTRIVRQEYVLIAEVKKKKKKKKKKGIEQDTKILKWVDL